MTDLATADASNAQTESPAADGPVSLEDNIDNAFATIDAREAEEETPADPNPNPDAGDKVEPSPEEAAIEEVVEQPADVVDAISAPDRFTDSAKTEWANTPPAIQAEVERMRTELESGLTQKDEQLSKYAGLEDLQKLAESQGQTLADVAKNYAGMENMLRQDPIAGFRQIAANLGLNLNQIAAHVMNVRPDQQAARYEGEINNLKRELQGMKQQFKNIDTSFTEQTNAALQSEISAFAKDHEHFETVRAHMAILIQTNMAKNLPEAYKLAVKERGLTASETASTEAKKKDDLAAQTQKGKLSVAGAPASGSTPDKVKPSKSAREAIDRAFSNLG